MFLLLWTPLDLGLLRHRHMGINSRAGFRYSEPIITFQVVHMGCHVMEELGSICDEGDC
jgi:hypothetical protein